MYPTLNGCELFISKETNITSASVEEGFCWMFVGRGWDHRCCQPCGVQWRPPLCSIISKHLAPWASLIITISSRWYRKACLVHSSTLWNRNCGILDSKQAFIYSCNEWQTLTWNVLQPNQSEPQTNRQVSRHINKFLWLWGQKTNLSCLVVVTWLPLSLQSSLNFLSHRGRVVGKKIQPSINRNILY